MTASWHRLLRAGFIEGSRGFATGSLLAALAFLLFFSAAHAQSPQSAATFQKDWAGLIARAKTENTVVIATGGEPSRQYRPMAAAFEKKFGISVQMSTGSATDTDNRLLAERRAGKFTADLVLISIRESEQRLLPAGALVPIAPLLIYPDVVDASKWYGGKIWYGDAQNKFIIIYDVSVEDKWKAWYNASKISKADINTIKGQWDFFDPRWKGKIEGEGMNDPSGIRIMINSWLAPDRGPKWVETYLLRAGVTFSEDRRVLETWLVSGRFPLKAPTAEEEELVGLAAKGMPVKELLLPRARHVLEAGGSGCCVAVLGKAPHPNAAQLFVNWFLSKEGQTVIQATVPDLERATLREDVPQGHVRPDVIRTAGTEYDFPDADPTTAARQLEAQKKILKIWRSRQ